MNITVKIKNVYGKDTIYPADRNAETFALLAGKKTLSRQDLELIKQLGFVVSLEAQAL